jgi:hypothetical protein
MRKQAETVTYPAPPQAAMIRALKATLEQNGSFGDAFAALSGFVAKTLPDGIQVGTHAAHKTGAVIGPTIAALTCADATVEDLAACVAQTAFRGPKDSQLSWTQNSESNTKSASATYPISQKTNLRITCVDEAVEPYFDGRTFAGATVILQLVQAPRRSLH